VADLATGVAAVARRWCWFSRPPSIGGTVIGSFAAGGALRDGLDDRASIRGGAS
jgi:hypothetical protein